MNISKKNTKKIKEIVLIIIGICVFLIGVAFSLTLVRKPANEEKFSYLEQVARTVCAQTDNVIFEAPEDVKVKKTETSIEFSFKKQYAGSVLATLSNGEFVFERDKQIPAVIILAIIWGCVFLSIYININIIVIGARKNKKPKKEFEVEVEEIFV